MKIPDFAPEMTFTERIAVHLPLGPSRLYLTLLTRVRSDGFHGVARGWIALVVGRRYFRLVPLGSWIVETFSFEDAHEEG